MKTLQKNLDLVRERIRTACQRRNRDPAGVRLVAVTKERSVEEAQALAALGVKDFGENRLEGLEEKKGKVPGAVWHFIGNLQSNKAKRVAELADYAHSIESLKVAERVSGRCMELGKKLPVFLEVNVAGEASKHGVPKEELPVLLNGARMLPGIKVIGLMTMAPLVEPEKPRSPFHMRAEFARHNGLPELSMGMSNDFEVAVEEGATFVRIGSALFE